MERINRIFQWGFYLTVIFMAGLRSYASERGVKFEAVCASLLVFGFLVWAAIGYAYAWRIAIGDIRARWRVSRARAVTVRAAPALEISPEAEVLPGRCLCQSIPGHAGRCALGVCRAY